MVSHMTKKCKSSWDEVGLGGSVWIHFEGIRRWTVDLEVDNPKYDEYIKDMASKMDSRFWEGSEKYKVQKRSKT